MILAEHTAQITPRKEHRPASMESLYARFFPAVRRNHVDLGCLRSDQTRPSRLVPIHPAFPWAEVALAQMRVCQRAFLGFIDGAEEEVSWDVVI